MSKVLIAGYGSAGQYLIDFILKDHRINNVSEIHIMSRKPTDDVAPRLEISRVAAGISERFIPIEYHQCNFNNIQQMSSLLDQIRPDLIVYTGRYASGIKYGAYSYPYDIGYGVWMPMSVPYIHNLMKAVKDAGLTDSCKVINTSFPDGVNMLLDQNGLAPFCGAGNVNHLIPRIKRAAAEIYNKNINDISVQLIGSHYLNTYVSKNGSDRGCPSILSIYSRDEEDPLYDDEDETRNSPESKALIYSKSKDNTAGGQIRNQMIATDCAELVRVITRRDKDSCYDSSVFHIPGFKGLPGGFPVYYDSSLEGFCPTRSDEVIKSVNVEGLRRDGVIIRDGGIEFTDEVRDKMKKYYGIEYPEWIHLEELKSFADIIRSTLVGDAR